MDTIKVALVDNHKLMRHGLKLIIESFLNFEIVGEADNREELIASIKRLDDQPDLALVDVSQPEEEGFKTIEYILNNHSKIKCIGYSMTNDPKIIFNTINSGGKGYLSQDTAPESMQKTMIEVYNGEISYDSFFVNSNRTQNDAPAIEYSNSSSNSYNLKLREMEFIKHCCSDLGYKQIASKMNISLRTVHSYKRIGL